MAKTRKRVLALLMTLVMVLGLLPTVAMAEDPVSQDQVAGYYHGNELKPNEPEYAVSTAENGQVVMEKEITQTGDDAFRIDLTVETSTEIENIPTDAAVTLVIDISSSMQWDTNGGGYCRYEDCWVNRGDDYGYVADGANHSCLGEDKVDNGDLGWNRGDRVFAGNPNKGEDQWTNSRLKSVVEALTGNGGFLDTFASGGGDEAQRMVRVVAFKDTAREVIGWTDVATGNGLDQVENTLQGWLEGDSPTGSGTSIAAGLQKVNNDSGVTGNEFVILLSDGAPNRTASGSKNGPFWPEIQQEAGEIKDWADALYVVGYADAQGVGNDLTEVASDNCYIPASNTAALNGAFESIVEEIIRSANAWVVTDPMGSYITFAGFAGGYSYDQEDGSYRESGGTILWDLKGAAYQIDGNKRVYTLSYNITLNTGKSGFESGEPYPANDTTSLTYAVLENGNQVKNGTGYFRIPAVKGYVGSTGPDASLTLTKTWAGNVTPGNQTCISLEKDGHKYTAENGGIVTSGKNATLTFTGLTPGATYQIVEEPADYILSEGSVTLNSTVLDSITFTEKFEEPSCSNLENTVVDLQGSNCVVAARTSGKSVVIWTYYALDETEQAALVEGLENAKISNNYKFDDVEFISGTTAQYPASGAANITIDAQRGTVTFKEKSVWSKFLAGAYTYVYGGTENAVTITNSAKVADLTISKTFAGDLGEAPEGFNANFYVYAGTDTTGTPIKTFNYTDVANGTAKLENLPYGTYTVVETGATFSGAADYQTVETTYKVNNGDAQQTGTVTISSPTGATVEVVNTYTEVEKPHLVLEKKVVSIDGIADATSAQIGDTIVYEITVTNNGHAEASDVVLTDTVTNLSGLTVVQQEGNPSAGSVSGNVWTVGNLAADASATLKVSATVADSAIPAGAVSGSVKNKVTGSYNFGENPMPNPTPAEVETPVYKSSLTIDKVVLDEAGNPCTTTPVVAPGETVTFQITVTNTGFAAAEDVVVTDTLPAEMALVSTGTTPGYTQVGSSNAYSWTLDVPAATTEASTTATITVVAQVKTDALGANEYSKTIENVATMNGMTDTAEVEISNGNGGLKIVKSLQGSDLNVTDLSGKISFTVKNASGTEVGTVSLEEAISGKTLDLAPGTYTVYENAQEVADYSLVTTVNNEEYDAATGYSVTVEEGETAQVTFHNDYTAKIYRVIFDAAATTAASHDITLGGSVQTYDRYTWISNRWGVVDTEQTKANTLELIFTKDQMDAVDGYNVGVQAASGYAWNEQFVLDSDENVTYDSFAAIVADLASRATMDTDVEYLDGSGDKVTGDVWTIRVHAEYDYDLTYTFNDFGSEHVSMAYAVGKEATTLTPVTKFGSASAPVLVCAQENLEDPDDFQTVFFFVKAEDGYQLGEQYWEASSDTVLSSVTGAPTGELLPLKADSDDPLLIAAHAAGYTHYFVYLENGTEADGVFKANVLNRYFKVVATENPTYTITGTKTVELGGNRAPGSTTFTFNLEGYYYEPEVNALSMEIGGDVKKITDTATVTINGAGTATFQFDTVEFTQPGWYEFYVTEKDDRANTTYWRYDNTEYVVSIRVIETEDGSLEIFNIETGIPQWENDELIGVEKAAIAFTNTYTRRGGGGGNPGGGTNIPDEDPPTTDLPDEDVPQTDLPDEDVPQTDLPDEDVPQTDLPDEDVPMAEAPKTGDNMTAWVLAAGVSGIALVWLAISGKKRREDNAQ